MQNVVLAYYQFYRVAKLWKNAQLHKEVDELSERIVTLYTDLQKLKDTHPHQWQNLQEESNLKRIIEKA